MFFLSGPDGPARPETPPGDLHIFMIWGPEVESAGPKGPNSAAGAPISVTFVTSFHEIITS